MEELLEVLRTEGLDGVMVDDVEAQQDGGDVNFDDVASVVATEKRTDLGVYLTMQRRHQV